MRSSPSLRGYEAVRHLTGYYPNPAQERLHLSPARHRVAIYGRQTGKTHGAAIEALAATLGTERRPHPRWWLLAPTYDGVAELWEHIRQWTSTPAFKPLVESITNKPMELRLVNAGLLQGKSADQPDFLRGPALDGIVVEEAAGISDYALKSVLLPMFIVTRGRLLAITSPRGKRHWTYRWFLLGQDSEHPEVRSFHATPFDNPMADLDFIKFLKDEVLTDLEYRQEVLAEFVEDAEQVFRRVDDVIAGGLREPVPGKSYVIGVDWAKVHDFTVFCVGDVHARAMVAFERFHRQDYNLQVSRLKDLSHRYNHASILMDSTGIGDPILDMCQREGLHNAEGYQYTWRTKKQAIDALALAIERGELRLPDVPQIRRELEAYSQTESESGNVKYGAPSGEGYYDDCVSALALMWWQMSHGAHTSQPLVGSRFSGRDA